MRRDLVSPVLIGRRAEVRRLTDLLHRAQTGDTAIAVIAGEAGVGKSRLVREVATTATGIGVRVLAGGCVELGAEGIPLVPIVDMLRVLARSTPTGELDTLLGPARAEFARLLPELDPSTAAGASQDQSAAQLFEHVLGLITRLAAHRPLLLIVEDLHWADRSTRDLVALLVGSMHDLGVLLILTFRSDEMHRRHPLRSLASGWERISTVHRIDLARFSRGEVATQVAAISGTRPATGFLDVVFERSQGNAFLVEEIVGAVDGGADARDLPPSLRDMLLTRTETVSEAAQRILRTASAAGQWVPDRLLAAVADVPEPELYAVLREAVEHHLLVVDPSGRGYAFRHALTRDAVYDDVLPGERVRLHASYAEALTADPTLHDGEATLAATLAHHWYAALDLPRALVSSVQAGRQAAGAYAPAEALRHLERAMQIWPRVPDADELTGVDWIQLNSLAADAACNTGELHRALSIIDQMLIQARPEAGQIAVAQIVERRAFVLRSLGRDGEAVDELRGVLATLPAEPVTATHAAVLSSLANSLARSGVHDLGYETAHRAVATAAAISAPASHADSLITLGSVAVYRGDADGGLTALREGLDLAERHQLPAIALRGYINLSDALEMLGRHADAVDIGRTGIEIARRVGQMRSLGAFLVGNVAEPLIRSGRWREALDLTTESLADEPTGVFASTLLLQRSELFAWQGDTSAARRDLAGARQEFGTATEAQFTMPMAFIEAELDRADGRFADAARIADACLADPIDDVGIRYGWPLFWLRARIAADAVTMTPAESLATAPTMNRPLSVDTLSAHQFRAMFDAEVSRADGRSDVEVWQAAVDAARAADDAYPLAYCLFRLTEALCHHARFDDATATVAECLRLADDIAAAIAVPARTLARRARLRLDEPVGVAREDAGVRLTDREREVLALVAEGRSNGQIATALFISPKTASVHVSNILAKFGASGRVEAVMRAHRLGLLPEA